MDDKPRLLADARLIEKRRAELDRPHIKPLAVFSARLREHDKIYGKVPDFDPWDGGVSAGALFLFEKPGPKAFASGFVSRNNNDQTAENSFKFMVDAGIPRKETCLWNVVPGWNGTIKLTGAELRSGAEALPRLLDLLENLRVIVLVGKRASSVWSKIGIESKLPIIESAHPSPKVYATARATWNAIPGQWAQVLQYLK